VGADRPRVALTLGKFDGVHRGHQHLLAAVRDAARSHGAASAALVLHPHPATVLAGHRVPVLTEIVERLALVGHEVDHARELTFDTALASLTPEAFLDRLAASFDIAAMVVGPDFAFGRGRAGTIDVLAALGAAGGFEVVTVPPLILDGAPVSSARIRAAIERGDVAGAGALLGRPPRLRGTVVHGEQRGRTLGYPTANLALGADYVVPANGIYAVRVGWRAQGREDAAPNERIGAASLGVRPQFDGDERTIEVYLLDFESDLYGFELAVDFLAFLRPEARFESVEALVAQIGRDVAAAREVGEGTGTSSLKGGAPR